MEQRIKDHIAIREEAEKLFGKVLQAKEIENGNKVFLIQWDKDYTTDRPFMVVEYRGVLGFVFKSEALTEIDAQDNFNRR